jgi:predicted PurR-regulated permease PerM
MGIAGFFLGVPLYILLIDVIAWIGKNLNEYTENKII